MLMIISPAKKLDIATCASAAAVSEPALISDAGKLVNGLRMMSAAELGRLMKISPSLSELNVQRYCAWQRPFTRENARQAIFSFRGAVYDALDVDSLTGPEIGFAQDHLRILSGLYGVLCPLDLMQPYRLEMGTRLANVRGRDLYAFWGDVITDTLNQALAGEAEPALINLASNEYSKAVQPHRLTGRMINVRFREQRPDGYKIIGIHAKKARGMMSRFIIQNRIIRPDDIKQFNMSGYRYHLGLSSDSEWSFTRE